MNRNEILIGIGAPKAGSTFLTSLLVQSQYLSVAPQKEVNYFALRFNNYTKSLSWYEAQFPNGETRVKCDFSPAYFSDVESASLIHESYPNAKLLVIVRDPLKRAFSAYLHHKRACRIPPNISFEDALNVHPSIINDSHYEKHLSRYFKFFAADQVEIVFFEEIIKNPLNCFNQLLKALNLPLLEELQNDEKRKNEAWLPRSYFFMRVAFFISKLAKYIGLGFLVRGIRNVGFAKLFVNLNSTKAEVFPAYLNEVYANEFNDTNSFLKEVTQRDSLPWQP